MGHLIFLITNFPITKSYWKSKSQELGITFD